MAIRNAVGLLGGSGELDEESFLYSVKRRLLGPPMINEELRHQRLSKPLALGVLSPDGISSSAYGPEEILIALLPLAGLAAFTIILPITLVILVVMVLVVLSYREVVMVYIRPGGSYVVARENFGPRIAQIAAVALLIDYVVTVAVQISAGTAAVVSAFSALGPWHLEITVGVILLMCYGNLRGIKEAGRIFAVPTYLFSGAVIFMIVVGLVREALGQHRGIAALPGRREGRVGQPGDPGHEEAKDAALRDQHPPGVDPLRRPERAHRVGDRLDAGQRRATVGERAQQRQDHRERDQARGAAADRVGVGQRVRVVFRQVPGDLADHADDDHQDDRPGEQVRGDREGLSRLLDPAQVAVAHDQDDADGDAQAELAERREGGHHRRGARA